MRYHLPGSTAKPLAGELSNMAESTERVPFIDVVVVEFVREVVVEFVTKLVVEFIREVVVEFVTKVFVEFERRVEVEFVRVELLVPTVVE